MDKFLGNGRRLGGRSQDAREFGGYFELCLALRNASCHRAPLYVLVRAAGSPFRLKISIWYYCRTE